MAQRTVIEICSCTYFTVKKSNISSYSCKDNLCKLEMTKPTDEVLKKCMKLSLFPSVQTCKFHLSLSVSIANSIKTHFLVWQKMGRVQSEKADV